MAIGKPLIVGMGRVGNLTALLLTELGMQVAGVGMETLSSMPTNIDYTSADITDPHILADLCHGKDAVIACLPYHLILGVAQVAHTLGIHYFDLTEDVSTAHAIRRLGRLGGRGHDTAQRSGAGLYRYARRLPGAAV